MISEQQRGRLFGLGSGFTWALYITVLSGIMMPFSELPLSDALCVAFVGMLLNECSSLGWLTLTHAKDLKHELQTHANLLLRKGWLFIVCPLGMLFFVGALALTDESTVAVGTAVYPISSLIIAHLALKRPFVRLEVLAVFLCTIGLFLTAGPSLMNFSIDRGLLLALLCALCWGAEAVLCYRFVPDEVPPFLLLAMRFTCSCLVAIPVIIGFIFFKGDVFTTHLPFTNHFWLYVPLAALISLTSYLCYYRAIHLLGPIRALSFNITYMIWVFIFAFFSSQWPTLFTMAGALFIGLSLVCSSLPVHDE